MKRVLRAVAGGVTLGLAFFVLPVLGRVVAGVGLLAASYRLLGGGRRRLGRRAAARRRYAAKLPLPIDNQWYRPGLAAGGPVHSVALS